MAKTSPDVSAIAGYAGDHQGDLFATMVRGFEAANHLTVLPNVKDQTPLMKLAVTKGLRPFNSKKQFESQLKYTKRQLVTGVGKKELLLDVEGYRNTYLSKYLGASANDKVIPFDQFTNEEIINTFGTELNDGVIYFGLAETRFAALAGAAQAIGNLVKANDADGNLSYFIVLAAVLAGETPVTHPAKFEQINGRAVADGLQIHITEAIADGDLTPVVVGEVDNETVFAIEANKKVFRSLPTEYRKGIVYNFQSFNSFDLLEDDMEEKQKYTVTDPSTGRVMDNAQYVPGTGRKCIAVACGWMGDSERIISSQKENLIIGCDLLSDSNQIIINPDMWEDEMGLKFNIGVNFANVDAIAINDRD